MEPDKLQVISASLLHDLGKVILRSGQAEERQDHSSAGASQLRDLLSGWSESPTVLDCVRYHHIRALENAGLPDTHPAWLICEADNIAAGADRRSKPTEGDASIPLNSFRSDKCLDSVFNLVRNTRLDRDTAQEYRLVYGEQEESGFLAPQASSQGLSASRGDYAAVWTGLKHALTGIDWGNPAYINSLCGILEGFLSYVPSSTDLGQVADISLYDHSVMTAAVAACIHDWAKEQGETNLRDLLHRNVQGFRQQEVFLIAHADLSGIQDFIYTISSKKALKSLRGRSFYLEILLEQIADEILTNLELSRANILYSGGGGFYLLLPNTKQAIAVLTEARGVFNSWLLEQFSIDLFLGLSWSPATANHFMDTGKPNQKGTAEVFRAVSSQLSVQKLQRYAHADLEELFTPERPEQGDRECSVCGQSHKLVKGKAEVLEDESSICEICNGLIRLGSRLIQDTNADSAHQIQLIVSSSRTGSVTPLPSLTSEAWLSISTTEQTRQLLKTAPETVIRVYSKNRRSSGLDVSTRLWVGDYNYCAINESGAVEFEDFVTMRGNEGIGRIAVLRADVDNLGSLFAGGFRGDAPDKATYETLGRYATLSRSLSRFFKSHINHIARERQRNLVLVYAGGDDIFAVGAWDEVIDFAIDLRERFRQFTGDKLSFSAGIAFFRHNFPISRMAELTGDLEHAAKKGNKDQAALFGMNIREGLPECQHVFSWDRLQDGVLTKRDFLIRQLNLADETDSQTSGAGRSFLYKVYELLLAAEDKLSLARLAYLIARREPPANAPENVRTAYNKLRDSLYSWAVDPQTRKELITAIMLCVYTIRKRGD